MQPEYRIGQKVRMTLVGQCGTIDATFTDAVGTQYRVTYLDTNGVIQNIYAHPCYLEEIK